MNGCGSKFMESLERFSSAVLYALYSYVKIQFMLYYEYVLGEGTHCFTQPKSLAETVPRTTRTVLSTKIVTEVTCQTSSIASCF